MLVTQMFLVVAATVDEVLKIPAFPHTQINTKIGKHNCNPKYKNLMMWGLGM